MKTRRRLLPHALWLLLVGTVVVTPAASAATLHGSSAASGVITLNFETQPDPPITTFWTNAAATWNKLHPTIQVKVGVTPVSGGVLEYPLLTALANHTGPDITDAIWTGFGAQLTQNGSLYPLQKLPGFVQLLKAQHMYSVATPAYTYKGNYFAIPEYVNPTMLVWNGALLHTLGLSKPPRTYGELLALAPKLPKGVYLTNTVVNPLWWQMWFSFIGPYYAATGGQPYWSTTKALFNNAAGLAIMNFVSTVFKNHWASTTSYSKDPVATGQALGYSSVTGPWSLPYYASTYPHFQLVLSPPLVPDTYPANKPVYTYGDSKGIGILTSDPAKVSAAWQFLQWYFSQPSLQAQFFKLSNLPPGRTDVGTNPAFASVIAGNTYLQQMLAQLPYSKLMVANPQSELLQTTFNKQVWDPVVYGQETPSQALASGADAINTILQTGGL